MSFYKVIYSETEESTVVLCDYDLRGFKYTNLLVGETVEQWDENVCLYYDKEGVWEDYLANPLHWPVASERFAMLLDRRAAGSIQCFSARLQNRLNGELKPGYYVVNVTELIPALDLDRSDYDSFSPEKGRVHRLHKPVISCAKVRSGAHIFRLAEYPFSLIVSGELRETILDSEITGIDFWEVEIS